VPLFRWILVSGSRVGKGIALKWGDIDLVRGFVTIHQEKTKRPKVLPLSTEARRVLAAQGRGLPDALVFPRPSGGAWEHAKLWRTFKLALTLAGVRHELRIHDLRHTAGSWLAQEGFSEAVIAEVLGHARSGVTAGYVHLRPEHLCAAVEKLGVLSAGDAKVTRAEKTAESISS
jgi:integrase